MGIGRKIEIEVSEDIAEYLDDQVSSGAFADTGEVVAHALDAARAADARTDIWLHEQVTPVIERMDRDGWSNLDGGGVLAEIRARNTRRVGTA